MIVCMNVYTTALSGSRNVHVHRTPDCRELTGNKHGTRKEVREVPLSDLSGPSPCRRCWPDAPRVKIWRPRCVECGQKRVLPCPHNGGVLVRSERRGQWTGRIGQSEYDPTKIVPRFVYVWPENAYKYHLVGPDQ